MTWHNASCKDVLHHLETSEGTGLTAAQAASRLVHYGPNNLEQPQKTSIFKRFLAQFNDYMVIILLIAAAISFVLSVLHGQADWGEPSIILAIVLLNATIGVVQENKAERALEALRDMTASTSKVVRDGQRISIPSHQLVPGDILHLQAGDVVPGDARLLHGVECKADESALTGESMAVDKREDCLLPADAPIGDRANMLWASTSITSGRGVAVVVATGMNSQMGKIADLILTGETPQTPLQQKLAKTGETLGTVALAICAVIFTMGVFRHIPLFEMFMTSVSLAVAAIPEGLPAIVTIMLALGVQKMARKNAIVRKLPAVETLGSASVICSDKTGTLTQNKMRVMDVYGDSDLAITLASLCNNNADPTEQAILEQAEERGIHLKDVAATYPRVKEVPFSSATKRMTTVHRLSKGSYRIVVKGAPDVILGLCNTTPAAKAQIENNNIKMARRALRVIGVAYADVAALPTPLEQNLTFVGLIGMMDPPRPEVKTAVALCKTAGIQPVMITGDHLETACAIAKEIGLMPPKGKAMTGAELNALSDSELEQSIAHCNVFARVTPEHKVRIVEAFQNKGHVVAMTGDGVNDAPALQKADIGCAMGITGTDVAKGAADMVLTDDNFATIVESVRQGRGIYDNIRKAIHFLLSSNIGELLTIFIAMVLGWPTPLLAIQLLWVNLVTDSLPAIALGLDAAADDVMERKPVNRRKGMFTDGLAGVIALEGCMIGLLALTAFALGNGVFGDLTIARSMAFCVLSLSQLAHAFNVRSDHSVFYAGLRSNPLLFGAFAIGALLQITVVMHPALAAMFGVAPLNLIQWQPVILLSVAPLVVVELSKWVSSIWSKREMMQISRPFCIK